MQTLAKYKKICYHKQADFDNDKKRPHGQAVKTLPSHGRICGSIPHGATKKIQHHLVWCCIFLYAPKRNDAATCCRRSSICASKFLPRNSVLRRSKVSERACKRKRQLPHGAILLRCVKRRGNLFAVVRQFAQANSCRRLPSPTHLFSCQLHMGNGNFRMGLHTSSVRGTTRQLVCRRSSICASKFCRSSPFYGSQKFLKEHANGNGNFRMGLHTSSLRETTRQLVCRRSYLRQQILAVGSHRPHFCFPVSYIWETATSAWGCILLRCVKRRGNLFAVVHICVSKFCRSSPFYGSRENPKEHANGNGNFRMGLHTSSVRGKNSATSFLYDKRFFRLNTI